MDNPVLNRRAFVLGASAVAAIMPFLASETLAQGEQQAWEEVLKRALGDAQPTTDHRMLLELPETAENGNMVPFTISVDSPMAATDYVKAVHLISTANPQPSVATFRFTPLSGRASVVSRMRLARTQDVIALAELGDGKFLMTRRQVKVTIGGCGA